MRIIACAAMALLLSGCTDPDGAKKVLAQNGYKDVHATGYSWFGCGKKDVYRTEFTATSQSGSTVNGVVCSEWGVG